MMKNTTLDGPKKFVMPSLPKVLLTALLYPVLMGLQWLQKVHIFLLEDVGGVIQDFLLIPISILANPNLGTLRPGVEIILAIEVVWLYLVACGLVYLWQSTRHTQSATGTGSR